MLSKQLSRKYTALHDKLSVLFLYQEKRNKEILAYHENCTFF